jgi:hypothetical protein
MLRYTAAHLPTKRGRLESYYNDKDPGDLKRPDLSFTRLMMMAGWEVHGGNNVL